MVFLYNIGVDLCSEFEDEGPSQGGVLREGAASPFDHLGV